MDFKTITFEKLAEETSARSQWTKIAAGLHKEAKMGFLGRVLGHGADDAARALTKSDDAVRAATTGLSKAQQAAKKPAENLRKAEAKLQSLERARKAEPLSARFKDSAKSLVSKDTMKGGIKKQQLRVDALKANKAQSGVPKAKEVLTDAQAAQAKATEELLRANRGRDKARAGLGLGLGGVGLATMAAGSGGSRRGRGTVVVA